MRLQIASFALPGFGISMRFIQNQYSLNNRVFPNPWQIGPNFGNGVPYPPIPRELADSDPSIDQRRFCHGSEQSDNPLQVFVPRVGGVSAEIEPVEPDSALFP